MIERHNEMDIRHETSRGFFRRGRSLFIFLCIAVVCAAIFGLRTLTTRIPALTHQSIEYSYALSDDRTMVVPVGGKLTVPFQALMDRLISVGVQVKPVTTQASDGVVRLTLCDATQQALAQTEIPAGQWYSAATHTLAVSQPVRVGEAYTLTVELLNAAGELGFAVIQGAGYPQPTASTEPQASVIFLYGQFLSTRVTNLVVLTMLMTALALLALFLLFANESGRRAARWAWMILAPIVLLALVEGIQLESDMFAHIGGWLAVLLYAAMMWLLMGVLGSSRLAQISVAAVWFVLALVSRYKMQFKGTPLVPWDIFSAYTAADVLGGYALTWSSRVALGIVGWIGYGVISWCAAVRWWRISRRLLAVLLATGVLAGTVWVMWDGRVFGGTDNDRTRDTTLFYQNQGVTAAFMNNTRKLILPPPPGYAPEKAAEIVGQPPVKQALPTMQQAPSNIIVIMNESFADLQRIFPFATNQPALPRYTALSQGTMHGTLQVSVIGGGTCTTEFEVLTGNSALFMPTDSTAYVQYILPGNRNAYSLANSLKSQGYQTVAIHPANAKNWNRETVYPLMGFDRFLSVADMQNQDVQDKSTHVRGVYRDDALYAELGKLVAEKPAGSKLFIHCVTIQNHGGYTDDPSQMELAVRRTDGVPSGGLDTYLSLMRLSDEAIYGLLEQAKTWQEPTLILFFGDHQPKLAEAVGKPGGSIAEQMRYYEVPFMFWSNQPLPAQALGSVSPNYLGGMLLEIAGLSMSPYQQYLAGLRSLWPVLTTQGARDARGHVWAPQQAIQTALPLQQYQMVQYNLLFDKQGKQDALFQ